MHNSNLFKLLIVLFGLNAPLVYTMGIDIQKNNGILDSENIEYTAKLKGQIQAKVKESFLIYGVSPVNDLANIVSDYAVDFQAKLLEVNKQLLKAAKNGDIKTVKEALEDKADINYIENGTSALTCAVSNSHKSVIKFLIANGANVNDKHCKLAPLMIAVDGYRSSYGYFYTRKQAAIIKLLFSAKADVNAVSHDGYTALTFARDEKARKLLLLENPYR